ncbi:uncharacterized protein LOC119733386 [Patiria miniata]|uniref:Uncharacterized protein n=1 Tax=Patiria miniata TaxID=46514 RepID=A0A914AG00_PATMI|nr:uncharacterized protein LOC119733386 [Patiria miniata]
MLIGLRCWQPFFFLMYNKKARLPCEVQENIKVTQEKKKKAYAKRKGKNVNAFQLEEGMFVPKRNYKKIGRKGSKMEPNWIGLCRISNISDNNVVTLKSGDGRLKLKNKVQNEHL